ncbi:MAG: FHA domain-containing protein [Myxococcota bacterium]
MFRLVLLDPQGQDSMSQVLSTTPVYVGRGATNDVVVARPAVSSRHAAFFTSGDKVFVEDLSSRNGTFVDGRRVQRIREVRPSEVVSLGDGVQLRLDRDEQPPRPLGCWLVEDRDTMARVPVRGDRFRVGADALADLCLPGLPPDDEVVLLVDPDGAVWRGDGAGELLPLADGASFAVGGRELRLLAPAFHPSVTAELEAARYRYHLAADLDGPTGPRAEVSDPVDGHRAQFTAPSRATLLYLLARQRVADRDAGIPRIDRGWCADADVALGLWGRSQQDRNLNVLVTRVRNDLRKAGLDPWFVEKRHGFVRVRLDDVAVRP